MMLLSPTSSSLLSLLILSATVSARHHKPAPSPSATGSTAADPCKCGYVLTKYNNAYYPKHAHLDFSSLPEGQFKNADALSSYGFTITDGGGVGGTGPDGTHAVGSYKNLAVKGGVLQLKVPGGQKKGGAVSVAEIHTTQDFTGGVFTASMKIDKTVGTCQALFTYHSQDGVQDEQDIENLGAYLFKADPNGTPPGVELTNFDPTDPNNVRNNYTIDPYPSDPTTAFHNYTIAWLNSTTQYYFDNTALKSPTKYFAGNPSYLYLNHWTDADPNFTKGPPTTDAIMQVKFVDYYYHVYGQLNPPSGCTVAQACKV